MGRTEAPAAGVTAAPVAGCHMVSGVKLNACSRTFWSSSSGKRDQALVGEIAVLADRCIARELVDVFLDSRDHVEWAFLT